MNITVRDSTFELILERLVQVASSSVEAEGVQLEATLKQWLDEWSIFPPGCNRIDFTEICLDERKLLLLLGFLMEVQRDFSETDGGYLIISELISMLKQGAEKGGR